MYTYALLVCISFHGCNDREMEKIDPNPPLPDSKRNVIAVAENVKNFPVVDAPVLKGLIGKTNWAKHPDETESVAYAVKRMEAAYFSRLFKGRGYSKSVFGGYKRLLFGKECSEPSLNIVNVSPIDSNDHKIINIKGCLSVEPKAFALFELNIIAGEDDLPVNLNGRSAKPSPWKRVFDLSLWQEGTAKESSQLQVDPKIGNFIKKLQSIVEPLIERKGLLNGLKVSAIMFRLSRYNTKKDGKGVGFLRSQSVEPIVLYVSSPSENDE